jgi:hypothetical protein
MTDKENIIILNRQIAAIQNQLKYVQNSIETVSGSVGNVDNNLKYIMTLFLPYIPLIGTVNEPILEDVAITTITIDRLNYNIKTNDKLKLINYETGTTFDLRVDADGSVGDTDISIVSFTPTENIMSNNFIFFSMVRDSGHKLEIEH